MLVKGKAMVPISMALVSSPRMYSTLTLAPSVSSGLTCHASVGAMLMVMASVFMA